MFGETSFTVPTNCAYYRQNVNTINLDTTMICINNELPSTYEEYNETITKTDKFKNVIFNDYIVTPEATSFLKTEIKRIIPAHSFLWLYLSFIYCTMQGRRCQCKRAFCKSKDFMDFCADFWRI